MVHNGAVNAVAFSHDGSVVVTGSEDNAARLWDAATGKPIGQPLPHGSAVTAAAFSPDGKIVLTGSVIMAATALGRLQDRRSLSLGSR